MALSVTNSEASIFFLPVVYSYLNAAGVETCLMPVMKGPRLEFEIKESSQVSLEDLLRLENLAQQGGSLEKVQQIIVPGQDKVTSTAVLLPWPLEQLGEACAGELFSRGLYNILSRDREELIGYQFLPRGTRSLGSLVLGIRRHVGDVVGGLGRFGARALLRLFAADAGRFGIVTPDYGFGYRAFAPTLASWADDVTQARSVFVLFEDCSALIPHCSHDDVRQIGRGRCSHWGDCFYFAAIDNSDPNRNGKRYRVFPKHRGFRFVHPLMRVCSGLARFRNTRLANKQGYLLRRPLPQKSPKFQPLFERFAATRKVGASLSEHGEVHQLIGTLGIGGAERQLCYLSEECAKRGHSVQVATYPQSDPEALHYLPFLKDRGIAHYFATPANPKFNITQIGADRRAVVMELLNSLPSLFAREVIDLFSHLSVRRPEILHCWLDHTNLIGSIAGVLAEVPRIIISTRNLNPTNFQLSKDWYLPWYRVIAKIPGIIFVANSFAGAKDYANWIGISPDRFTVVPNGIDLEAMKPPTATSVRAFRERIGLEQSSLLIAGVMRLAVEKRPFDFLHVVRRLRDQMPNVRAVIVGSGPIEGEVRKAIADLNLTECVSMYGTTRDVAPVMASADLVLLTSEGEGTPNALIEAQWYERPVVCTRAGGAPEVVIDAQTGYVCDIGDIKQLANRCALLLQNPELARGLGIRAKTHTRSCFSLARMVEQTLALYDVNSGIIAESHQALAS